MTPIAAEGLPLTPPLQHLVATEPEDIAKLICHYHTDQAATEIVSAETRLVTDLLSADRVTDALRAAVTGSQQVGLPAPIPFAKEPGSA
jgi:hypothetical protein